MGVSLVRSRWAAIGAAVAVSLGAGGLSFAGAVTPPPNPVTTMIAPCRLMDTRAGSTVGPRGTPVGARETYTATVWGTNGNCTIPANATGVVMNVTIVNPTGPSFLTVWPADKAKPNASQLNWVAGQAPTPNQVSSALSVADGKISLFNLADTVDVIADITGYLTPADLSNYYTKAEVDSAVAVASACKEFPHRFVDWHGCALPAANLSYATLIQGNLAGADLDHAVFSHANLISTNLTGANLNSAQMDHANGTGVNLTNADLTLADLSVSTLTGSANLTGATLWGANLTSGNLTGANLTGANLTYANIGFVILTNANLTNANLTGAIFTASATFTGVIWNGTICPDGTNSDSHGNTCIGHL